jgi:hypothetical protein
MNDDSNTLLLDQQTNNDEFGRPGPYFSVTGMDSMFEMMIVMMIVSV